jgi:hypothetical protein
MTVLQNTMKQLVEKMDQNGQRVAKLHREVANVRSSVDSELSANRLAAQQALQVHQDTVKKIPLKKKPAPKKAKTPQTKTKKATPKARNVRKPTETAVVTKVLNARASVVTKVLEVDDMRGNFVHPDDEESFKVCSPHLLLWFEGTAPHIVFVPPITMQMPVVEAELVEDDEEVRATIRGAFLFTSLLFCIFTHCSGFLFGLLSDG